jgi:hypothetical protein
MIEFPYSIESLKNGDPEAVEWAKGLKQEYMDDLAQKCNMYEEDWALHEYYEVITMIRKDDYDFSDIHFHALAKAAFFDGDKSAQAEMAELVDGDTGGYRSARKIAYSIWCSSCDGRILAYALLMGITLAEAREISDFDELSTSWEYGNGDSRRVYRDLVETLLYEDEQPTQWKKAPRIILLQLIKDSGIDYHLFAQFVEKYKNTEWGKSVGIKI